MNKYFVRYQYSATFLVRKIGCCPSYEREDITTSCIVDFEEASLSILNIQQHLHDAELKHLTNRPEPYNIDILLVNKL